MDREGGGVKRMIKLALNLQDKIAEKLPQKVRILLQYKSLTFKMVL